MYARKKSVKSRANIGKMSLAELNEALGTADLTPYLVVAHFIATIPSILIMETTGGSSTR